MDNLETQAKSGDVEALATLFHQHEDRLRRVIDVRMDQKLRGRIDPSDVLQEAYLDLVQRLPAFASRDDEMSVFVWMRLVTSEKLLQLRRQHVDAQKRAIGREISMNRPASDQSSACLADRLHGHFSSAGNKLIRNEMRQVLMNTLDAMDEIDREIILMRGFEELSNVEAAEVLGVSQNGASNRFVRAMTRLKRELEQIPGFSV